MKIYTEVNFRWDDKLKKYSEVSSDSYDYEGPLSLAYGGGGGNDECFVAGTKVKMSNGLEKNIEDIKIGEQVLSYNIHTKKIESKKVTKLFTQVHDLVDGDITAKTKFSNGVETHNTIANPFWSKDKGFVAADAERCNRLHSWVKETNNGKDTELLEVGDILFYYNGSLNEVIVKEIEPILEPYIKTYDITVEDNHTFFANGILTHNSGDTQPPPPFPPGGPPRGSGELPPPPPPDPTYGGGGYDVYCYWETDGGAARQGWKTADECLELEGNWYGMETIPPQPTNPPSLAERAAMYYLNEWPWCQDERACNYGHYFTDYGWNYDSPFWPNDGGTTGVDFIHSSPNDPDFGAIESAIPWCYYPKYFNNNDPIGSDSTIASGVGDWLKSSNFQEWNNVNLVKMGMIDRIHITGDCRKEYSVGGGYDCNEEAFNNGDRLWPCCRAYDFICGDKGMDYYQTELEIMPEDHSDCDGYVISSCQHHEILTQNVINLPPNSVENPQKALYGHGLDEDGYGEWMGGTWTANNPHIDSTRENAQGNNVGVHTYLWKGYSPENNSVYRYKPYDLTNVSQGHIFKVGGWLPRHPHRDMSHSEGPFPHCTDHWGFEEKAQPCWGAYSCWGPRADQRDFYNQSEAWGPLVLSMGTTTEQMEISNHCPENTSDWGNTSITVPPKSPQHKEYINTDARDPYQETFRLPCKYENEVLQYFITAGAITSGGFPSTGLYAVLTNNISCNEGDSSSCSDMQTVNEVYVTSPGIAPARGNSTFPKLNRMELVNSGISTPAPYYAYREHVIDTTGAYSSWADKDWSSFFNLTNAERDWNTWHVAAELTIDLNPITYDTDFTVEWHCVATWPWSGPDNVWGTFDFAEHQIGYSAERSGTPIHDGGGDTKRENLIVIKREYEELPESVFGIGNEDEFKIEDNPSLDSSYDPYSGIDLRPETTFDNTCVGIEIYKRSRDNGDILTSGGITYNKGWYSPSQFNCDTQFNETDDGGIPIHLNQTNPSAETEEAREDIKSIRIGKIVVRNPNAWNDYSNMTIRVYPAKEDGSLISGDTFRAYYPHLSEDYTWPGCDDAESHVNNNYFDSFIRDNHKFGFEQVPRWVLKESNIDSGYIVFEPSDACAGTWNSSLKHGASVSLIPFYSSTYSYYDQGQAEVKGASCNSTECTYTFQSYELATFDIIRSNYDVGHYSLDAATLAARCSDGSTVHMSYVSPPWGWAKFPAHFHYLSGNQACQSKLSNNNYLLSINDDKRPPLGLFYLEEDNQHKYEWLYPTEDYSSYEHSNFVKNSSGAQIKKLGNKTNGFSAVLACLTWNAKNLQWRPMDMFVANHYGAGDYWHYGNSSYTSTEMGNSDYYSDEHPGIIEWDGNRGDCLNKALYEPCGRSTSNGVCMKVAATYDTGLTGDRAGTHWGYHTITHEGGGQSINYGEVYHPDFPMNDWWDSLNTVLPGLKVCDCIGTMEQWRLYNIDTNHEYELGYKKHAGDVNASQGETDVGLVTTPHPGYVNEKNGKIYTRFLPCDHPDYTKTNGYVDTIGYTTFMTDGTTCLEYDDYDDCIEYESVVDHNKGNWKYNSSVGDNATGGKNMGSRCSIWDTFEIDRGTGNPPTDGDFYFAENWLYSNMAGVSQKYSSAMADNTATHHGTRFYKQFPTDGTLYHTNNAADDTIPVVDSSGDPIRRWLYTGWAPYIYPWGDTASVAVGGEWAKWIFSKECHSEGKCLNMHPTKAYWDTDIRGIWKNQMYATMNQTQKVISESEATETIVPYSRMRVSFWMKTKYKSADSDYDFNNVPAIEACLKRGSAPYYTKQHPGYITSLGEFLPDFYQYHPNNSAWMSTTANYKSHYSYTENNPDNPMNLYWWDEIYRGSCNLFKNNAINKWEKKEFTFEINGSYIKTWSPFKMSNIYLILQWGNETYGNVYIDDIEVSEAYDFIPDVDVRAKKGPNNYGKGRLTEYYDKKIDPEKYSDTTAPLEAQFYFYPRMYYEDFKGNMFDRMRVDSGGSKKPKRLVLHKDFEAGLFYISHIDWGDGSPKEFTDEPKRINYDTALYHRYEDWGIFQVTGYMLRTKPSTPEVEGGGVVHNVKFRLNINVNEGDGIDFEFFGSDGFKFIPYNKATPMIGGISEQSAYYKYIRRQLGFVTDDTKVDTTFKEIGDKLKTETALLKMNGRLEDEMQVIPEFKISRYDQPDGMGELIYEDISPTKDIFGEALGDTDLTNVRYFNTPRQMHEMLGFEDNQAGNPQNEIYWKNIIPEDYDIFKREGIEGVDIDVSSNHAWIGKNNYNNDYYYPVLPKYNKYGRFLEQEEGGDNIYPNNNIPFPENGPISEENYSDKNLKVNIVTEEFDNKVLDDKSGNKNVGFTISDYKPIFDKKTSKPKIIRSIDKVGKSTKDGAF